MPVIKRTNQYTPRAPPGGTCKVNAQRRYKGCAICGIVHDKDLLDLSARTNKTNHVQRAHDQHCMDISERQMSYLGVMIIKPWTYESKGK